MPTFTPILRLSKTNAEGTAPIYIRISDSDGSRFVSLGKRIQPKHWDDDKERVLGRHSDYKKLNRLIEERLETLRSASFRIELDGPAPSADQLQAVYRDAFATPKAPEPAAASSDYFDFADGLVVQLEKRGQIRTHNRYKTVTKKFRAFVGEALPFEAITPRLLRDFETHLIKDYSNSVNTVATNLKAIRAILNQAIREGHADQRMSPFFQYAIKQKRVDKTKLTYDEIVSIRDLDLLPDSLNHKVRDYFLFSFYCAGVRFGDLVCLRGTDITRQGELLLLSYKMGKTGFRRTLQLPRAAEAILQSYGAVGSEDFVFPPLRKYDLSTPRKLTNAISSQNAVANKYLKKIAVLAEIKSEVTFHISRHSFADYARRVGWSVYDIAKMLGHASLKTTETYLARLDGAPDRDANELFD